MEIRVVEKIVENNSSPSNKYSFKFALFPDCPGFPEGLVEASDKAQWGVRKPGQTLSREGSGTGANSDREAGP